MDIWSEGWQCNSSSFLVGEQQYLALWGRSSMVVMAVGYLSGKSCRCLKQRRPLRSTQKTILSTSAVKAAKGGWGCCRSCWGSQQSMPLGIMCYLPHDWYWCLLPFLVPSFSTSLGCYAHLPSNPFCMAILHLFFVPLCSHSFSLDSAAPSSRASFFIGSCLIVTFGVGQKASITYSTILLTSPQA